MNRLTLIALELKRSFNSVLDPLSSAQVDELLMTRENQVLGVMRPSSPSEKVRGSTPADPAS